MLRFILDHHYGYVIGGLGLILMGMLLSSASTSVRLVVGAAGLLMIVIALNFN